MQLPSAAETRALERVALDSSVLLSGYRRHFFAAADLRLYAGYWSSWITSEVTRKRTEWIAQRAIREGWSEAELTARLILSRERLNSLIHDFSGVLQSVDYATAPPVDLSWLRDRDDWPVMQTALAAKADVLVTDNTRDFPLGEARHGVLFLGSEAFLAVLYGRFSGAEEAISAYLP